MTEGCTKDRKTALITGASAGIGYELTWLFAREGYNLVLIARNKEKLEQLADELTRKFSVKSWIIPIDLSSPTAPGDIFKELGEKSMDVDVLVNNAGFGTYGPFERTDLKKVLDMIQLNIAVLTHLTKLFLPGMLENGSGKILNVASLAGFLPGPYMSVYYATKAYVLSFSEALASELEGTGVTVSVLCPGTTETGFFKRAGMENTGLTKKNMMDARTVAQIGYDGLMRGKNIVIPGIKNKLIPVLIRFFPRGTVAKTVGKIQGKRVVKK